MSFPTMKTVEGDGIQINLAVWEGSGKTILAVHGITANCRCWDAMATVLTPAHRLIAMDLRGRGRSDKPPSGYAMDCHIGDIHAILDRLEIEKAVLMGHSLGAFIALAFGARHPDRVEKIILVDGAGKLSRAQFEKVFTAIKPALDRLGKIYPSAEHYIEAMKSVPHIHPWSETIENFYRYELAEVSGGVRTNIDPVHIQEESANVRNVAVETLYPRIRCQVLILRATRGLLDPHDRLLPEPVIEEMIRSIPRAYRFDVAGANHYGIVFQPHSERDLAILNFLEFGHP